MTVVKRRRSRGSVQVGQVVLGFRLVGVFFMDEAKDYFGPLISQQIFTVVALSRAAGHYGEAICVISRRREFSVRHVTPCLAHVFRSPSLW